MELLLLLDRVDVLLDARPDTELDLVRDEILKILARRSVRPIAVDSDEFDPAIHEVLAVEDASEPGPDKRVVSVARRGYRLGDSTLRPAGVVISHMPG